MLPNGLAKGGLIAAPTTSLVAAPNGAPLSGGTAPLPTDADEPQPVPSWEIVFVIVMVVLTLWLIFGSGKAV